MNKLIKFFLIVIMIIYWIPLLIWRYYEIVPLIPFVPIFGIEHQNWKATVRIYKRDYVNYWVTPSKIGNYDRRHKWCPIWKWRYFYHNHKIEREWYYYNCEKFWEWFQYDDDGSLWKITNYNWDNNWTSSWYYENGNIMFTENYKNNEKDWEQIHYYENGKIQKIENYKNWFRDWKQFYYYNDGNILKIENYKYAKRDWIWDDEIKDWKWVRYKENGEIEKTETYHDWYAEWQYDQIVWKYFYKDGPVKEEVRYRKWKIISRIEYDENGNIVNEFKSEDY